MAEDTDDKNAVNQKVSNALLRHDIEGISAQLIVLTELSKQIHNLDIKLTKLCTQTDFNKEEIKVLKNDISYLERRDWIGAFVATTVASIIGVFTGRQ